MSYETIMAEPSSATGRSIRITEQGEVIHAKYSNPLIALRNLEQLASSVLLTSAIQKKRQETVCKKRREGKKNKKNFKKKSFQKTRFRKNEIFPYSKSNTEKGPPTIFDVFFQKGVFFPPLSYSGVCCVLHRL